jgi:2-polyprenyl-3-methyl-5-hydroxy-6-metoxy-1,4-benzoquinol methylase
MLWEQNQKDRNLSFSKWDKLRIGAYLVLSDYAQGVFPPTFPDREQAHLNEINTRFTTPGTVLDELERGEMIKPFWANPHLEKYLQNFLRLVRAFDAVNIHPPAKILELGGGAGWTAEFLAQMGFHVVSTTISPFDVALTQKRAAALKIKGLPAKLEALVATMEKVADQVKEQSPFDAVFVFEALHHAFDWRESIDSCFSCLRKGGWFLLCNEPNFLHTAISYRVARLTTTHEVGFRKSELIRQLRKTGFQKVISLGKKPHLLFRPHWLLAQK